jgi:hypothetical protein
MVKKAPSKQFANENAGKALTPRDRKKTYAKARRNSPKTPPNAPCQSLTNRFSSSQKGAELSF